jgi:hypothetical protein
MGSSFLLLYQFSSVYFMSRGRLDLVAAKCSFSLILCENVKEKMFLHPHSKYPRTNTNTRLCVRIKEFSYYTWNVCIQPAHAVFHSNFQLDDWDFPWRKLSGMFNVVVKITNAYSHNHTMKNVERMFVFYVDVQ